MKDTILIIFRIITIFMVAIGIGYQVLRLIFGTLNLRADAGWLWQHSYLPHIWSIVLLFTYLFQLLFTNYEDSSKPTKQDRVLSKPLFVVFLILSMISLVFQSYTFIEFVIPKLEELTSSLPHLTTICICIYYVFLQTKAITIRNSTT